MDARLLQTAYDREALRYDARFADQQRPKILALAALLPAPAPGALVLDLGAGTGLAARTLRPLAGWETARFLVADLSPAMLRHARAHGLPAVVADARQLPFRRAAFPLAVCVTGLVGPEVLPRALASVARVVAPGGLFGLSLRAPDLAGPLGDLLAGLPWAPVAESESGGDRVVVLRRS